MKATNRILVALGFLCVTSIYGATIVTTGPNAGTSFRLGGASSQVEAISWTQTGTFTGVSISALVGSEDGSPESVTAYLTAAIGSGAAVPIATATITVPSFANDSAITSQALFNGLTLGSGSYYLTLFNTDTTGNVNLRWARGSATTFGTGVTGNSEYFANSTNGTVNTANPWRSTFVASNLYDNGFTVTGNAASAVPEPGTTVLFAAGVVAFSLIRRRK